jgi:ABC-type protease/lipase transport system fused ATPase/permease subunit
MYVGFRISEQAIRQIDFFCLVKLDRVIDLFDILYIYIYIALCFTFDFYGMIIVGGRVFKELDVNCNKN